MGRGEERFTSRAMIDTEQRLERATAALEAHRKHGVAERLRETALARSEARGMVISIEQQSAFEHVIEAKGIGIVVGYAGTGKSAMLGVAREAWEAAGYEVQGAALSGIAARESGAWLRHPVPHHRQPRTPMGSRRDRLSSKHVLVIDEAGMIGTRQMERVIAEAEKRGAKVVLVGDPELSCRRSKPRCVPIGGPSGTAASRSPRFVASRRMAAPAPRDAWRPGAPRTPSRATSGRGHGPRAPTRSEQARTELVDRWDRERAGDRQASRIILTHTNDEVQALNGLAREPHARGRRTWRGREGPNRARARQLATGDRVMFLRNERSLGVKNGFAR